MAKEKTCQTTIRLPESLLEDMRELTYLTRVPMNQTVIRVLEDAVPTLLKQARKKK